MLAYILTVSGGASGGVGRGALQSRPGYNLDANRDLVTMDNQYEMASVELTGHVIDDVT